MRAIASSLTVALISATILVATGYADAQITSISSLSAVQPSVTSVSSARIVDDNSENTSYTNNTSAYRTRTELSDSQRLTRVENQLQYLSSQLSQLQNLQQNLTALRGQVEQLNHQLQQTTKQVDQFATRLAQAESKHVAQAPAPAHKPHVKRSAPANAASNAPAVTATPATAAVASVPVSTATVNAANANPAPATPPATDNENQAFQAAYNAVSNKQYPEAITGFKNFIATYPKSTQLADAYYWLGELYLFQGQADLATQQFQQVISLAPKSPKAPDAMLKLGTIFLTNGDAEHAKQMFKRVATEYQGTTYADVAAKQLQAMQ